MRLLRGKRFVALLVVLGAALARVAIPIGRRERSHADAVQVARMRAVQAAVGTELEQPALSAYRIDPGFLCLLYARGERYFAYELCYDPLGRLVETVDRSGSVAIYGSVVYDPALAPSTIARPQAVAMLIRHRVPAKIMAGAGF